MAQPLPRRLASYLLGAFVCAELVYLPLANLIQLAPRQMPPFPDELLGRLQRRGADDGLRGRAGRDRGGRLRRRPVGRGHGPGAELVAVRPPVRGGGDLSRAGSNDRRRTGRAAEPVRAGGPGPLRPHRPVHYRLFYREMSYRARLLDVDAGRVRPPRPRVGATRSGITSGRSATPSRPTSAGDCGRTCRRPTSAK